MDSFFVNCTLITDEPALTLINHFVDLKQLDTIVYWKRLMSKKWNWCTMYILYDDWNNLDLCKHYISYISYKAQERLLIRLDINFLVSLIGQSLHQSQNLYSKEGRPITFCTCHHESFHGQLKQISGIDAISYQCNRHVQVHYPRTPLRNSQDVVSNGSLIVWYVRLEVLIILDSKTLLCRYLLEAF